MVELIHQNNDHLGTGFLGTPYLMQVLTDYGYTDLAYKILLQKDMPGWMYPVTHNATTIWEKWDPYRNGEFDIYSLNHTVYGAVGEWLYESVAGIRPAAPGYKKIVIAPHPGGGLTWVNSSYECPYGLIVSNWKIENGLFKLHVLVPPGTTATIELINGKNVNVDAGVYDYSAAYLKFLPL